MIAARVHVKAIDGHVAIEIEGQGTETLSTNAALYAASELQRAVAAIRCTSASSVLADTERGVGMTTKEQSMRFDRTPEARITGPAGPPGSPFRWHARYTVGIGIVESGSFAFTRRGIERRAQRVLGQLRRENERYANETVLR